MIINKNFLYLILVSVFLIKTPILAIDIEDLGDFSSRSVIMNKLNNKQSITQEQRDLLESKKLTPTSQCLIEQIKKGNIDNINLLLQAKVNPNVSYMGEYPIYTASKLNKLEIVQILYENKAKLDRGFFSELYEAVKNKNPQMAQYLIDKGAKVNYSDSITGNSILYLALKNNMTDIAIQLIQKGANPDKKSIKLIKKKKLISVIEDKLNKGE